MLCPVCMTENVTEARFCFMCSCPLGEQVLERIIIKPVDPVLKPREAAAVIKVDRSYLDGLQKLGLVPENCYFELPTINGTGKRKTIRYKAKELIEWDRSGQTG